MPLPEKSAFDPADHPEAFPAIATAAGKAPGMDRIGGPGSPGPQPPRRKRREDHGVVYGWYPMHEKQTRVSLTPNPYGPATPKKLDLGIDYPEAGIVNFQHMGPDSTCHGVQVAIHFDGNAVRILAWVDAYGDRDADLIVELRENQMKVERAREVGDV